MIIGAGLEIITHPHGLWLVRAGREVYAVPALVGRGLLPWQGEPPPTAHAAASAPAGVDPELWTEFLALLAASLEGRSDGDDRRDDRLPPTVWLRLPLLPAVWVRGLAGRLVALAGTRGLLGMGMVGSAGYLHLGLTAGADPTMLTAASVPIAIGCFLLTAVWHEMGHATALAREGYPPGGIGAGLLFVVPVLFADVTAVGALPRAGRVRVDLGGVVFQFGFGGVLAALGGVVPGGAPLIAAGWLALAAVVWSLFPFIRADGYWLVCDLLAVSDLESAAEPGAGWPRRCVLFFYRVANALFLMALGVVLPWRAGQFGWEWLESRGLTPAEPLEWLPLVLVGLVGIGLVWRRLARRAVALLRVPF